MVKTLSLFSFSHLAVELSKLSSWVRIKMTLSMEKFVTKMSGGVSTESRRMTSSPDRGSQNWPRVDSLASFRTISSYSAHISDISRRHSSMRSFFHGIGLPLPSSCIPPGDAPVYLANQIGAAPLRLRERVARRKRTIWSSTNAFVG